MKNKISMSTLIKITMLTVLWFVPVQAEATLIFWDFEGTLSAQTSDLLGIDGEVVQLHVEFDTSDTWMQGSDKAGYSLFYFPSTAASASITGQHTIDIHSAFPAARYSTLGGGIGGITEGVDSASYVDFIIDGYLTTTYATNGPPLLSIPAVGDHLNIDHLRDDTGSIAAIKYGGLFYDFVDSSVSKNVVPEPSTMLLLGSGLLSLCAYRKKFKK